MSLTVMRPLSVILVHHQQFLDAVLVEEFLRFVERRSDLTVIRFSLVMTLVDRQVIARLKAQVPIGQNAHEFAVLGDGNTGDPVAAHQFQGFVDLLLPARS